MNPKVLLGCGIFALLAGVWGLITHDAVLLLVNSITLILVGIFGSDLK